MSMSSLSEIESQAYASEWARRHIPSSGAAWDAAVDYGVDVTLLLENLTLTPAQRLAQLQGVVRLHAVLRNARRSDE